ncbi:hypothetical protein OKW41_004692 [Paraburkholderia sp. UCT70]|uniref:nuclear transport factor 2 family protein n=1 Tax=Paraburkholderia sp. UCT70 TaxID=2991068 RepID=UPI003D1D7BC8
MSANTVSPSELQALQHEIFRLNAVREIQNLMGAYTVNHLPKNMHDHIELFAMNMPDVSVEVGDRGVYVGPDALRTLFGKQFSMDLKGNMLIHYLATPMIEVAADGKTAKGVWRSPGIEAVRYEEGKNPVPLWSFGAYACDFIYVDGKWKIWHLHWFRVVKCTFKDGWVDDLSMTYTGKMAESPDLKPTTYHNPYTPETVQESVPPCPLPYDSWADDGWAVKEQILGER